MASVTNSIVNLLNNVVGAGLFSMPWCLKEGTLVTGCAVFVFMALLNMRSFMLLAESCEMIGKYSYLELGKRAFGERFGFFAQSITCCYTAGSLVSYVVLAADCLVGEGTGVLSLWMEDTFLADGSLGARALVVFAMGLGVFLPFSLLRNLDALKYISMLAFFATLFAGFIVVFQLASGNPESTRALDDDDNGGGGGGIDDIGGAGGGDDGGDDDSGGLSGPARVAWAGFPLGVWEAVPIINVAFTAHYNGPRFFVELADRTLPNFRRVVGASLGGALVIYLSVAVCGYLSFGKDTQGDVLENFKASYPLAVGARVALLAILMACFPKVQHALRDGLVRLSREWHLARLQRRKDSGEPPPPNATMAGRGATGEAGAMGGVLAASDKPQGGSATAAAAAAAAAAELPMSADDLARGPYTLLTLGVVLGACLLGAVCEQVEVVLAYKGGIFGSLMVYILPPLMHTAISMDCGGGLRSAVHTEAGKKEGAGGGLLDLGYDDGHGDDGLERAEARPHPNRPSDSSPLHERLLGGEPGHEEDDDNAAHAPAAAASALSEDSHGPGGHRPWPELVRELYTNPKHRLSACIFTWGCGSGTLAVVITILSQAGVLGR